MMEATVAGFIGVVCRHLWLNGDIWGHEQLCMAKGLSRAGNWVMRFISKVVMVE